MSVKIYKHNKTGVEYLDIGRAINATNAQDQQVMVVYSRIKKRLDQESTIIFVREENEFLEKFKLCKEEN